MPEYVLVVVLTHLLERPLPSQGQAVRSDLSPGLGSSEQVAPTELARAGTIYYKQVAPPGLNDLWVKTRSPNGTKGPNRHQNPFRCPGYI